VSFADAVENPRRLALLLHGLRDGDPEALAAGLEDRLHVPWRLPLLPGASETFAAARAAGAYGATLSGAGSGLVALAPRAALADVRGAMEDTLVRFVGQASARILEPVLGAPEVRPGQLSDVPGA